MGHDNGVTTYRRRHSASTFLPPSAPPRPDLAGAAMTVWEDLMNCVCQNAPQRPGIQEMLDSLERHTVCTDTQCFEGEGDAFGLTVTPNATAPSSQNMFFMFMMFMMTIAFVMRLQTRSSSSESSKAGSSSSHSNEPPPPPSIS